MTSGEAIARFMIVGGALFVLGAVALLVSGLVNRTDKPLARDGVFLGVMLLGAVTAFAAMFVA